MLYPIGRILQRNLVTSFRNRYISYTKNVHSPKTYEGEGKTFLNILNNEADLGLMINGYSEVGFRLNNNVTVLGPMVIFPRSVLSWSVTDVSEINEETLSLLTILEPKIDIIVIGIGDKTNDHSYMHNLVPIMRKYKLSLEVLPTDRACSIFNFLNSEGRYVVGAFIPPKIVEPTEDDVLSSKIRYQNLYDRE